MSNKIFLIYLVAMAGTTYLIRLIPILLCKKKITNKYVCSFLYYMPYAVLSAMTFPSILHSTNSLASAIVGMIVALVMAYFEKSLLTVAATACCSVFIFELLMRI